MFFPLIVFTLNVRFLDARVFDFVYYLPKKDQEFTSIASPDPFAPDTLYFCDL